MSSVWLSLEFCVGRNRRVPQFAEAARDWINLENSYSWNYIRSSHIESDAIKVRYEFEAHVMD